MNFPRLSERSLLIIAGLLIALASLFGGEQDRADEQLRLSTATEGPLGGAIWPRVASELELESEPLLRTWIELDRVAEGAALAVLAPQTEPEDGELDALLAWLAAGGQGVWVLAPARLDEDPRDDWALPDAALRERFGLSRVDLATEGLIYNAEVPVPLAPATQTPVRGWLEFDATASEPRHDLVVNDSGQAYATRITIGEGSLSVFASAEPFANAHLGDSDLPAILARELDRAARLRAGPDATPRVLFDERHHGHGGISGPAGSLLYFLLNDALGLSITTLGLLALAWLIFGARRLGPPLAQPPRPRRSSVEHAHALASGYARAQANQRPGRALLLAAGRGLRPGREVPLEAALAALANERTRVLEVQPSHAAELEPIARALRAQSEGEPFPPDDLPQLCEALDRLTEISHRT